MNILEEFWSGNIEPAEYDISSSKEYKALLLLFQNSFRLGGRMMLEVMRGGIGNLCRKNWSDQTWSAVLSRSLLGKYSRGHRLKTVRRFCGVVQFIPESNC